MSDDPFPEHAKLSAVADQSQAIGEFIDEFLPSKGIHLCATDPESSRTSYWPIHTPITRLLAEFFGIDEDRLEAEKRQILEMQRDANRRADLLAAHPRYPKE